MANTRGVFSLQDVRFAQEDGDWVDPGASFVKYFPFSGTPNVGYFAGGSTPSDVSSIDKMTFTDDTTVLAPSANLTATNRTLCGFGNRFNAYWSGGRYGGPAAFYSGVEKLSYQTDTVTKSPASNLVNGTADGAGTAIDEYGYICGGSTPTNVTTVNKLVFTHDTVTQSPSSALNTARNGHAAIGNQTACYLCGGESPITSNVEKVTFATDTREAVTSNVAPLRAVYGASGDAAGYIGGGNDGGPVSTRHKSTVVKFTFSGETTSTLPSANSLRNSVSNAFGAGNSTHGYFGGGDGYPSDFSNFTKIQFSDDTASNVPTGGNLTATRYNGAAACPRGKAFTHSGYIAREQNLKFEQFDQAAYYMGGYGDVSNTSRLDFTTDTMGRNPSARLYVGRAALQGMSSSKAVYAAMGSGTGDYSSIDKLTVADQTTARIPNNMNNPQYDAAICTAENAGYAAGGLPGPKSTVDKFSFESETAALLPSAVTFVTPGKYHLGSVSTMKSHGYWAGGITPSANSAVDRINYATETVGRIQNLPANRAYIAGMSGPEYGYFTMGSPGPLTNAVKIQFSTDTISDSTTAISYTPFTNTYNVDQAGNSSSHGYAVGGWQYNSICQKLNYATEQYQLVHTANIDYAGAGTPSGTNNAAFTGTMENHRSLHVPKTTTYNSFLPSAYSSAPDFALMNGGGTTPGASSSTDKLTFSTETGSLSPAQNTLGRSNYLAGFSNTTYGWTCGGYTGPPAYTAYSTTDRVTYSTETMVNVPSSNMPGTGRYGGGYSSSPSAGYYVSGYVTSTQSTTLKLPFTPGTWSELPSGSSLSSGRYYFQGAGGKDKGYFGGGSQAGVGVLTKYDKLTYSTDTMQICSTLNTSDLRQAALMAGMSKGCYLGTGQNPGSPPPVPIFGYFMDFATDTTRGVAGMVTVGKQSAQYAATEREVYWVAGISPAGLYGSPAYSSISSTDKFSYATETSEKLPSADVPAYRAGGANMNPRENGVVQPLESNVL